MFENLLLLVTGLIGGFVGAQAGGGALIILPVLLFYGLTPLQAIGAIVFSGVFLNIGAASGYWKTHKPDLKLIIPIGMVGALGSVIGAYAVNNVASTSLSKIAGLLLLIPIALLLLNKNKLQNKAVHTSTVGLIVGTIAAFIAGLYGGFLSISSTTLFVLLFAMCFRRTMVQAAADAVTATIIFSTATLVVFIYYGTILYALAIPLAIGSAVGSVIGARTAVAIGDRWIKVILIVITLAAIAKLLL